MMEVSRPPLATYRELGAQATQLTLAVWKPHSLLDGLSKVPAVKRVTLRLLSAETRYFWSGEKDRSMADPVRVISCTRSVLPPTVEYTLSMFPLPSPTTKWLWVELKAQQLGSYSTLTSSTTDPAFMMTMLFKVQTKVMSFLLSIALGCADRETATPLYSPVAGSILLRVSSYPIVCRVAPPTRPHTCTPCPTPLTRSLRPDSLSQEV